MRSLSLAFCVECRVLGSEWGCSRDFCWVGVKVGLGRWYLLFRVGDGVVGVLGLVLVLYVR